MTSSFCVVALLERSEFQCPTDAAGDTSDESRDASGNGGGTNQQIQIMSS